MSKLEVKLPSRARGKAVAKIREHTSTGRKTTRTVVLDIGGTNTIDVEPGRVAIQVQMPSGELLTEQATVGDPDETMSVTIGAAPARQEWLDWQQALSPQVQRAVEPPVAFSQPDTFVDGARLFVDGEPIAIDIDGRVTHDGLALVGNGDETTFSLTIEGYRRGLPVLELEYDGRRDFARPPIPWLDAHGNPLPVQLILERADDGTRADVIVHDPELSPILAYFATGNLAAVRELSAMLEERARMAVMGKVSNPIAAVASAIVLRQVQRSKERRGARLPEAWIDNLAGIESLPDGAILAGARAMDTGQRPRARELLLTAYRRGLPVFAHCGRLLLDHLQHLHFIDRSDVELANAFKWARALVDCQREDTLLTWLAGDAEMLARVVDPAAPDGAPPPPPSPAQPVEGPSGFAQAGVRQVQQNTAPVAVAPSTRSAKPSKTTTTKGIGSAAHAGTARAPRAKAVARKAKPARPRRPTKAKAKAGAKTTRAKAKAKATTKMQGHRKTKATAKTKT